MCDEGYARGLRTTLANEHLDGADGQEVELSAMFDAFAESALRLQQWHDASRVGHRPPGRLRPLEEPPLSRWTRIWATPMYRTLYDPDGRSPPQRLTGRY